MKKNNKNQKIMKIIVAVVAIAMVVTTFSSVFSFGGINDSKNPQVVENNTDSNTNTENNTQEKVNTDITDALRKDMENAKVEVKDKEVIGVINVSEAANKAQADKLADEYTKTLKDKYKDKNIKVQVVYNKEKLSESSTYVDVNKDPKSKLPKTNVQISAGLSGMDRYVAISLDTDKPEQYVVKVLGQDLKYVPSKKFFHGVVESTDEEAIKKGVKVTVKK